MRALYNDLQLLGKHSNKFVTMRDSSEAEWTTFLAKSASTHVQAIKAGFHEVSNATNAIDTTPPEVAPDTRHICYMCRHSDNEG